MDLIKAVHNHDAKIVYSCATTLYRSPVPKRISVSGLIPVAPTGSEWSPSKPSRTTRQQGSDSDMLEFQDVLRDLDKKAV